MRYPLVALGFLFVPLSTAIGQSQYPYGTPEATAEEALRADSLHNWRRLLALAHPDALEQHKRDQLFMFTMDDLPGMPEFDACMAQEMRRWHRFLLDSVYQVPTIDSLRHLPADTVFSRDQRYFGRYARLHEQADSSDPTYLILGHVLPDDSTAYVVVEYRYRYSRIPDWPKRQAKIMTLRRYHGDWHTMLDPDLGDGVGGIAMSGDDCN